MDWSDETWVKLYRRDTTDWLALSIGARGLFCLLLRAVNRAGVLDLGKSGPRAVAVHLRGPWPEVEPLLAELTADGCVQIRGNQLVVPNFIAAQEAAQSDKARARSHRERKRDEALGITKRDATVTNREPSVTSRDENVTTGHAASRAVTPRHEEKRSDETGRDEEQKKGGVGGTAPAPHDAPPPGPSAAAVPASAVQSKVAPPSEKKPARQKQEPAPDVAPAPGTPARRVYDAIVGDRVLRPLVGNPGDFATRVTADGAYPGVDVLAEVRRAGEYAASKPSGSYKDGRAYLRNWLQRRADLLAASPRPAAPPAPPPRPPPARATAPVTEAQAAANRRLVLDALEGNDR